MSRVVRAIAGVVIIAGAIIASPFTGGASLAFIGVGTSLTLGALAKKPKGPAPQGVQGNATGALNAHNIVFGKIKVGGVLHSLKTAGNSNEYVYFSLALSITHRGGADRIGRIWIESDEITEAQITGSNETDTAGQQLRRYSVTSGKFAGLVDVWFRRGTALQGTPNTPQVGIIGVTEYARGVATALVRLRRDLMNEAQFQMAFNGRFPSPVTFELYGNRVYDPRLDSTAGGSGSQRVADPTTWTWSDNPALCAATHSIMSYADGGEGLLAGDVNWFSVAAAANVCDQSDGAGGRIYRCCALLTTAADRSANTELILDSMAGMRAEIGTYYTFFAGTWRTPNFSIDSTWLRAPAVISPKVPLSQLYNAIRASARDERGDYSAREIPPYINGTFEAQDGNRRLYRDLDYPTVPSLDQAQRMVAVVGAKSRRQMSIMLSLNLRGMTLETWETGTVTLPGLDLSSRTFRIVSFSPTEQGPDIRLEEDYSADYGSITPQAVPVYSPPAVVYAQPPALTSFTGVAIADGAALSWAVTPAYQDFLVVVYRRAEGSGVAFTEYAITYGTSFRDTVTNGAGWEYYVVTRLPNGQQGNVTASTVIVRAKTVADGADVSSAVTPSLVINPGFEAGDVAWSKQGTGWTISNNPVIARNGLWYARRTANATASDGYLISVRQPVTPGGRYAFSGMIASSATVSGSAFIGLLWQDSAGVQISEFPVSNQYTAPITGWALARGVATAPSNAAFVQIDCAVQGAFTTGYWSFDDLAIVEYPATLDEVPDGSQYAKLKSSQVQRGALIGKIQGANLCPNPGFELNDADYPAGAVTADGIGFCDGWRRSVSGGGWAASRETNGYAPHTGGANLLISLQSGQSLGAGTYFCRIQSERINVIGGDDYIYGGFRRSDANAALPGTVSVLRRIGVIWYKADGSAASTAESYQDAAGAAGVSYEADYISYRVTAPADAAYCQFQCAAFVIVASGTFNTGSSLYMDARFDDMRLIAAVSIDKHVVDGTTYGRTVQAALTSGQPDFSKSGVVNKSADYVAETGTRRWAAETGAQVVTGKSIDILSDGTTYGRTQQDILTGGRPDFSKPLVNRSADYVAESSGRRWAAESGAQVVTGKSIDILSDGSVYGRTVQTALTSGQPDLAKTGVINKSADYVAETAGRRFAAESGATIGAVAGINLRRNSGTTLNDADVITSMGTANDVSNVGGVAATTVRDGGIAGAGLTSNSSTYRLGGPRNVGAVRFAGPGAIFDSAVVTASWNGATPATVTFTFTATTLRAGGFSISYATATATTTQGRSSAVTYYLYFDASSVLSGGTFTLLFTTNRSDLTNGADRLHVGTVTVSIPASGSNSANGSTAGGGYIP